MLKNFFFFSFPTLRFFFSGKSARVSSVFRTFPNLQNLMKTFKNTSKLQFINFHIRTPRPQPNQTQYTYIYIYFFQIIKTFKPSSIPCIILSKDWALAGLKPTAYVPRPLRIKAHVVPFQTIYIYTYLHDKNIHIYNMQIIFNVVTCVVSSIARLTAQE